MAVGLVGMPSFCGCAKTNMYKQKSRPVIYGAAQLEGTTFVQWPISPDVEFSNPNPSFVPKYDGYEFFFLIFGQ